MFEDNRSEEDGAQQEGLTIKWTRNGFTRYIWIAVTKPIKWENIKNMLTIISGEEVRANYIDSEEDEILVGSQAELDEFLRYSKNGRRGIELVAETGEAAGGSDGGKYIETTNKNSVEKISNAAVFKERREHCTYDQRRRVSTPQLLEDIGANGRGKPVHQDQRVAKDEKDVAPKWFSSYMKSMKDELITGISRKVTRTVLEAPPKRLRRRNCSVSDMSVSDSEYTWDIEFLDSDNSNRFGPAKDASSRSSKNGRRGIELVVETGEAAGGSDGGKYIETTNKNSAEKISNAAVFKERREHCTYDQRRRVSTPQSLEDIGGDGRGKPVHQDQRVAKDEKDVAPEWFSSYMKSMKDELITEISRKVTRTVLEALPKRLRRRNCSVSDMSLSDSEFTWDIEFLDSDNSDRFGPAKDASSRSSKSRRRVKKQSKSHRRQKNPRSRQEVEEVRCLSGNSTLAAQNKPEDPAENSETPYRRKMATADGAAETLEDLDLKLHLIKKCSGESAEQRETEEEVRMGCSVTGKGRVGRPNPSTSEYCALSDSDNISIISDASHYSHMQRVNNSFESVAPRCSPLSKIELVDVECVTRENPRRIDDSDNTRDSSSFELLSEPTHSPALSIHMDEEHFAPGIHETSTDFNINDETTNDVGINRSNISASTKIDKRPYAIDATGKIYQQNIVDEDEDEEDAEIVPEKRTGGAYSFAGETLPISSKKKFEVKSSGSDFFEIPTRYATVEGGRAFGGESESYQRLRQGAPQGAPGRENIAFGFQDSTQSFHSHMAADGESERQERGQGHYQGQYQTQFQGQYQGQRQEYSEPNQEYIPGRTQTRISVVIDHNVSQGLGNPKQAPFSRSNANSSEKPTSDSSRSRGWSSHTYSRSAGANPLISLRKAAESSHSSVRC